MLVMNCCVKSRIEFAMSSTPSKLRTDQPIQCTASRFGGDEFVLLLHGIDGLNDAIRIAEQLHARLAQPYQLGPYRTYNSASIGIVVGPADYQRAEEILRDADTAMYEAKRAGRNQYAIFDTEMHTKVHRRMQIKNEMRAVTRSDELSLNYQADRLAADRGNYRRRGAGALETSRSWLGHSG